MKILLIPNNEFWTKSDFEFYVHPQIPVFQFGNVQYDQSRIDTIQCIIHSLILFYVFSTLNELISMKNRLSITFRIFIFYRNRVCNIAFRLFIFSMNSLCNDHKDVKNRQGNYVWILFVFTTPKELNCNESGVGLAFWIFIFCTKKSLLRPETYRCKWIEKKT